jgi:hypothetical protein
MSGDTACHTSIIVTVDVLKFGLPISSLISQFSQALSQAQKQPKTKGGTAGSIHNPQQSQWD